MTNVTLKKLKKKSDFPYNSRIRYYDFIQPAFSGMDNCMIFFKYHHVIKSCFKYTFFLFTFKLSSQINENAFVFALFTRANFLE